MKTLSFGAALLIATVLAGVVPARAQEEQIISSRKVLSRVIPTYPPIARNLSLTGSVKLEATVAADGSVKSIQVLGGNPVFAQAAQIAVREWKWEKRDRETTEQVEVHFTP